nr:uroporphyrinogen-III synthase [Sterolibacterium denitrificans]
MAETAAAAGTGAGSRALPLAGRHIVVTRPAQQAGPLRAAIAAAGGIAVAFPVLEIHPLDAAQEALLGRMLERVCAGEFELAIFVSPNAIAHSFAALERRGLHWPADLQVAVVGKGSERALAERGVGRGQAQVIAPQTRFDSEGLLALPEMQDVRGKRVIIFRGDGGRELTASTLRERGATVEYITCYRRSAPSGDAAELLRLWQDGRLDAITMTSSEGLRHLYALLGEAGRALLETTPLFAPHQRIAEAARRLGLSRVIATAAGDAGLLQELNRYFSDVASSSC